VLSESGTMRVVIVFVLVGVVTVSLDVELSRPEIGLSSVNWATGRKSDWGIQYLWLEMC